MFRRLRFAYVKTNHIELWVWMLLGRLGRAAWLAPSKMVTVYLPKAIPLDNFQWEAVGIMLQSGCGQRESKTWKRYWVILRPHSKWDRERDGTRVLRFRPVGYGNVSTLLYLSYQQKEAEMERLFLKVQQEVCYDSWETKRPLGFLCGLEKMAQKMSRPAPGAPPFRFAA